MRTKARRKPAGRRGSAPVPHPEARPRGQKSPPVERREAPLRDRKRRGHASQRVGRLRQPLRRPRKPPRFPALRCPSSRERGLVAPKPAMAKAENTGVPAPPITGAMIHGCSSFYPPPCGEGRPRSGRGGGGGYIYDPHPARFANAPRATLPTRGRVRRGERHRSYWLIRAGRVGNSARAAPFLPHSARIPRMTL